MPALTLANIIGNEALDDVGEVAAVAGFGCVSLLVSLPIAYFLAGMFGMSRGNGKRTFGVCNGIQNYLHSVENASEHKSKFIRLEALNRYVKSKLINGQIYWDKKYA